jgi:parvulin-like peptidyl-prolyl isomerase
VSAVPELPIGSLSAPILEGAPPVEGRPEVAANSAASPASLPASAPRQVTFGVALVTYRGAQGAGPVTRTRADALALAETIFDDAKRDFAAAIKKADIGLENAGLMPRGVLEPGPEQALFGLAVGDVSKPVDSPRGYYVFKRID